MVAADPVLQAKQLYLNAPFFLGRAVFYFAVWNFLAYVINRWSLEQDAGGRQPIGSERKFRQLSAPGLMAYGLTITFASVDWVMSLDPHWFSTIFGVLFMGAQALSAMAFAIVALAATSRYEPLAEVVDPSHFHDLGKLLFAFVMLWAYFSFSQFLIIWSGTCRKRFRGTSSGCTAGGGRSRSSCSSDRSCCRFCCSCHATSSGTGLCSRPSRRAC